MSILKLLFFKHVSVKLQGSSGGVVYLIVDPDIIDEDTDRNH